MDGSQKDKLRGIISSTIIFECSLKKYTSFSIGGPAECLILLDKKDELQPLLRLCSLENLPWHVIGRGTNVLVKDEGFAGVIIVLGKEFKEIHPGETRDGKKRSLMAGAGHSLTRLSALCSDYGFSGLEFGAGIPGTLGGSLVMNAGAWGGEMGQIVTEVTIETAAKKIQVTGEQLDFGYRHWQGFAKYKGQGVVTGATLLLESGAPEEIATTCRVLLKKRKESQPVHFPNAGSFFKNPAGDSAGRLIDSCGLKGMRVGGAMVSTVHGNFIVNRDHATARDVLKLMDKIKKTVKESKGIDLEPEVHFI